MVASGHNKIISHTEGLGRDSHLQEVWVQGLLVNFLIRVPHVSLY